MQSQQCLSTYLLLIAVVDPFYNVKLHDLSQEIFYEYFFFNRFITFGITIKQCYLVSDKLFNLCNEA